MSKSVKEAILQVLKEKGVEMSPYKIAKELGVSWSTVKYHILTLELEGKVVKREVVNYGNKRVYYRLAT